jgi:drug/metabolite transporter (DMT)-like permease
MLYAMPKEERNGLLALLFSAVLFAVTTTLVRLASNSISGYLVSTIRFLVGIAACLAWLFASGRGLRVVNKKDWMLRGIFGSVSMTLSYMAISMTSGGRASMLSNTYPIFVAVFGSLFFNARLLVTAIPALALCTIGSVIILNDGSGYSLLGDACALLSAVFAGFAVNHLKRGRATDGPISLYLSPCLFGLPVVSALAIGTGGAHGVPTAIGIGLAVVLGLVVFAAQTLMTWGYKFVPAARGSRIFYLETVFAVGLGAIFGERLKPAFFLGAAIIMAALWLDGSAAARKAGRPLAQRSKP